MSISLGIAFFAHNLAILAQSKKASRGPRPSVHPEDI